MTADLVYNEADMQAAIALTARAGEERRDALLAEAVRNADPRPQTADDVVEALLALNPPIDAMREARERVRIITVTRELVEAEHAERTEEARLLAREIAPDQSIPSIIATAKAEALADFYVAWREAIDPI
jgi:hypothetical protein